MGLMNNIQVYIITEIYVVIEINFIFIMLLNNVFYMFPFKLIACTDARGDSM